MEEVVVFIDGGFLSKVSKYLGNGKYFSYNIIQFAKNLATKQNLDCKKIFYYTAPPFQGNPSIKEEDKKRREYDKFVSKLKQNSLIKIEEGRVQKLKENNKFLFKQKGVDTLLIMRLSFVPTDFPEIKKIILVSSDTDFCPVINELKSKNIEIILCSYYEKKRNSKFSVSHHLIDCCKNIEYLTKQDFLDAPLNKKEHLKY